MGVALTSRPLSNRGRILQRRELGSGAIVILWFFSALGRAQCTNHAQLSAFERAQFIEVSQGQRSTVFAQYLAERDCGRELFDALRGTGATLEFFDERSGFVLVMIPREKLLGTLDIAGVDYAYTRNDARLYYQDALAGMSQSGRRAKPVPSITIPYPEVAESLQKDGPYFAAAEIGLPKLWKEHPTADGRGTRIAVVDDGFDLLHPAMLEARDADGKVVPKIADLTTLTNPPEDSKWVRFGGPQEVNTGLFEANGRMWRVPKSGTYRFGIFTNNLILGPEGNSHSNSLELSVGVLWDEARGRIWVDTDGDGSFENERALGDYGETHDLGWFGRKDGAKDNRIPFGVKIDVRNKAAYIRIGGGHGALVGGSLAANKLTGGLFDGAAPGAQLLDENLDRAIFIVPSIVHMFARPDVDVINRSGGAGRTGFTGEQIGLEDFAIHVIERLIQVYQKPLVAISAAAGTIQDNDYVGPEMLRRSLHLAPPYGDAIHAFMWDVKNGLVNTVLAPSANLDTESRYSPMTLKWSDGTRRSYNDKLEPDAPDGYMIGWNPSPTLPVISGVLADLISEAKHERIRYNVFRLNSAIFTGARLLSGFPVSQQGYGLVDAAQSWQQLAKMAKADDPSNPELTSFAIARMKNGKLIEVQGYNADLGNPGDKLEDEIWITRHGGFAGARRYLLSLRGNNGSFELLDHEATLEQGKPVRVRFRTNGASGWNIALLELRDLKAGVVMQDVPISVRVPDSPQEIYAGTDLYESIIAPLHSEFRYVKIGDDVQAIRYSMSLPLTGPSNITGADFPGGRYTNTDMPQDIPVDAKHHVGPLETFESLVINQDPGIQSIFWSNRGGSEYATPYDPPSPDVPIHVKLAISKYGITIERNGNSLAVHNNLADIDGRMEFYDATLRTDSVTGTGLHAMGETEQSLPDHLAEWRLRVVPTGPSEGAADVYVLNCAGKNGCYVAAQQEISRLAKTLIIESPSKGVWKIAVRSRDQVQHPITYAIHEGLLVSATATVQATGSRYASGASWFVPLPEKQRDAQYAAFRIAGTPGVKSESSGLVIAMTPLDSEAP